MTLLRRLAPAAPSEGRGIKLGQILAGYGSTSWTPSGVYVDQDSAMRHDAVWSCVTAIAEDVAMMPVDVVRYSNGRRELVESVPQVVATPSTLVSDLDWRYQVVESWLLSGNVCGRVTATDAAGRYPTRIELLAPNKVEPHPTKPGVVLVEGYEEQVWPVGPIWHVPAFTLPGSWWGLSPIQYHRVKIGAGLAAEEFGSQFFAGSGHPTALLQPENDPGPDGAAKMKQSFIEATRTRAPAVLPQSVRYTQVQISPTDSQFLDTQRYTVEQICRIYREDPADHGSSGGGSSMTYANRSDADLARLKRRQFWVVKLQNALTACLPRPQVVRLNTSSALMMTPRERHELHELRLRSRTTTINEVRTVEDEPDLGEEFNVPGIPPISPAPTNGGAAA